MDIRVEVKQFLTSWLEMQIPQYAEFLYVCIVLLWIAVVWVLIYWLLHRGVGLFLKRSKLVRSESLKNALFRHQFFKHIALVVQGWVVNLQASFWLTDETLLFHAVGSATKIWMLVFGLLSFFSLIESFQEGLRSKPSMARFPIKGVFQTIKLVAFVLVSITIFSVIINKSPLILFSGLGALSAVLLLIFKDPILGLVSGIQLSANRMLAIGDWLEMPKYDADGDVIDISLTTVKVQNWDKTITTIPTYALISESFKNWRGMAESGGRRIKRSVWLDTKTIRFLNEHDVKKLNKAKLLNAYLSDKIVEIESENKQASLDLSSLVNGRRLTNIGTFRAYLLEYLKTHPNVHPSMTLLVRQLDQTEHGVPLQIYCFTNTTAWDEYERIQSDIFDHVFAVLPEFDLKVHEAPTGADILQLRHSSNIN